MTLTQLFTAIANAIRAKTGLTDTISAVDFPAEILEITPLKGETKTITPTTTQQIIIPSSGKNGITQATVNAVTSAIDNNIVAENIKKDVTILNVTGTFEGGASEYNAKIYTTIDTASNGILFNIVKLPVFTFTSTDANSLFSNFRGLEECPEIDFGNVTSMSSIFNYCNALTLIPSTLNTSNVTNMEGLCMYCTSLVTFPNLNVGKNTNFFRAFDNCTSLVNFPQLNIPKVTNMKNMFRACNSLSNESLNNILGMLASATSYNSTKTLYFIGLSQTQATTCTGLSNWASAQSAGWTTGY